MKTNIGTTDRIIRVIIAAILAILYFTNVVTGTLGIVFLVGAIVLLLTTLTGFCGLYKPFGINTCKVKEPREQ
jgi:hypothetical protein